MIFRNARLPYRIAVAAGILSLASPRFFDGPAAAAEPKQVSFEVTTSVVHRQLSPKFCWFHPRVAAMPGFGRGGPAVIMTIQKHLSSSDYYSGMCFLRTDDLGVTWSAPTEIPELAMRHYEDGTSISVADVTPGWHAPTGKLLLIGTKVRYSPTGAQLIDRPHSRQCAYATFNPRTGRWSKWQMLAMPRPETQFYLASAGCVQWLTKPDGTVLLPISFRGVQRKRYSTTVAHCSFDGETLTYLKHGDELTVKEPRGLYEPSLALFRGKYYLTLRNDVCGYVTTSADALHFVLLQEWTFDDGGQLGSYNTQQHWLVHSDGLFLSYTRRGAKNDHIFRHRAPLFLARVDPERLQVIRSTEQVLIPERGAPLGNFGAAPITANESWVTDAEFQIGERAHPRGADGSVYAARVRWSQPNKASGAEPK